MVRSLIADIAQQIIAPVAQKSLFTKPHLPFRRYLGCYQEAFEMGVVLGFTYQRNLPSFAQLFTGLGSEQQFITYIQDLGQQRVSAVGNVKSFFELAMFVEEQRVRRTWQSPDPKLTEARLAEMEDTFKVPVETAFQNLQIAVSTGIGIGSAFPELTADVWGLQYESSVDPVKLERFRAAGLDVPPEAEEPVPLADREKQLRKYVELFVATYRPELKMQFNAMQ
jgi:hypothetical protein